MNQICPCLPHPHTQHLPEINDRICRLQDLRHKGSSACVNYSSGPQLFGPGTGFVEDNFSTDGSRGGEDGSDSNASDWEP